ncbi:hypothetical protein PC123_g25707 [Phytophthora cactorum]|nr:hypothetical protein PC123_g25707 [Phytophthora cactorum]
MSSTLEDRDLAVQLTLFVSPTPTQRKQIYEPASERRSVRDERNSDRASIDIKHQALTQ